MKRNIKTFNRYFTCILYKDDLRFSDIFNKINKFYTEITYIIHNRDFNEDGSKKKLHYHIIFKVGENARSVTSICEEIGLGIQYVEGCNRDNMLLYLLHKNNPEKTQYNFKEVQGCVDRLSFLLEKSKDLNARYFEFVKDIEDLQISDVGGLVKFACNSNKIDLLLRSQYLFYNLVKINNNNNVEKKLDLLLTTLENKYNIKL